MRALPGFFNKPQGKGWAGSGAEVVRLDGTLTIDCRTCPGPQDLTEQACMRCCLGSLSGTASCTRIVLSRHMDVAYEGACIEVLQELAEAVRMCRGVASEERGCQACPARPSLVLGSLADSIPFAWGGAAPSVRPAQARAGCHSCASRVNDVATAVAARLRALERNVSREAFMVVEEPDHD